MTAQRWKRQERQIANVLGGVRLPNNGHGQCDVRAPGMAVQVKTRGTLPAWLWAAVKQAGDDAAPTEAPVVVLAEVQPGRKARRLVVLELDAFVSLLDRPRDGGDATGEGVTP